MEPTIGKMQWTLLQTCSVVTRQNLWEAVPTLDPTMLQLLIQLQEDLSKLRAACEDKRLSARVIEFSVTPVPMPQWWRS